MRSSIRVLLCVVLLAAAACSAEPEPDPDAQPEAGQGSVAALAAGGGADPTTANPAGRREAVEYRDWPVPEAAPGGEPYDDALRERMRSALATKAEGYLPRTHHMVAHTGEAKSEDTGEQASAEERPVYTNRLVLEQSPYLGQHAHNPVDWHAWGEEPFEKARRLGRPVFLSIGYSTCHWCHVMERESFEDVEIATFMNEHFVSIKVDREERPDIDDVYMAAVRMLTRGGGWPMTVVMTPDREPFFGGTYFPPRDGVRGSRKGFLSILRELAAEYETDRDSVVARAADITARIARAAAIQPPSDIPDAAVLFPSAVASLSRSFDATWGGFGRAPKFPRPVVHEFLMHYYRRTGDPRARQMFEETLAHMAGGGMYDHVGGGFHRYATDPRWLVPHFEKMLYDNAQLVVAYLDAYQITGRDDFARVARDTLDYVAREMTAETGAFYSATDADSPVGEVYKPGHEEEGLFFTWTPDELEQLLGSERAQHLAAYYGVREGGNFEGRTILHTWRPLDEVATEFGIDSAQLREEIEEARSELYAARELRLPPLKDTKILSAWNGLMISAFARGALVLGEPDYARRGERAAAYVLDEMTDGARLLRSSVDGNARHAAVLDDYAYLAAGLLDLFEATGTQRWLAEAIGLHDVLQDQFWDPVSGAFFSTAADAEKLLVRDKPDYDGARPSGNSVAIGNLLRLAEFTLEPAYRHLAERALAAFGDTLARRGLAVPRMMAALDTYADVMKEIVIVRPEAGDDEDAGDEALMAELAATYLPNRVLIPVRAGEEAERLAELVPLVAGKPARDGKTTAYVCEKNVCKAPTTDPAEFARQLATVVAYGG